MSGSRRAAQDLLTKNKETKLSFENFFSVVANKFIFASRARGNTASWNIPFKFWGNLSNCCYIFNMNIFWINKWTRKCLTIWSMSPSPNYSPSLWEVPHLQIVKSFRFLNHSKEVSWSFGGENFKWLLQIHSILTQPPLECEIELNRAPVVCESQQHSVTKDSRFTLDAKFMQCTHR